jgi:hypothetical protein
MKNLIFSLFLVLLLSNTVNAEFVCSSTTTAANIFADSDKSCTTDADVMRVTLLKAEFYNSTTGATWVLKEAAMSGDIGGKASINYLPTIKKSLNKPGTYTHFRGYMDEVITIKGGFSTADATPLHCVTAGATVNVFGMADVSCGDGTCITDLTDKAEVNITMNDMAPGEASGHYLYDATAYDVELLKSDGSTRATASGNVDQMRAIVTLASPIVITKNSKVSVEMLMKGTNALAIVWSSSSAAAGCTSISNVAPVFTITTTVTD